MKLVDELSHEVSDVHIGFRPGHQTAETAESVRMAVRKAHTWDRSLYIMKADVSRAFVNILHPVLHNALIHAQTPLKLQHALLQ